MGAPRSDQCGLWCRPLGFSVADAWKVASTIHMGIMQRATRGHSRRRMPRSAIMTGAVDLVLPVAKIPEILAKYGRQMVFNGKREGPAPDDHRPDRSCAAIPRAAVPNDRPRHREAHAHCAAAGERLNAYAMIGRRDRRS